MRTVASGLLASCLLLGVPHLAVAADKVRIEIVETTVTVGLLPHTNPGSPEKIDTHCNTHVAGNTARGDCDSTVIPATDPTGMYGPPPCRKRKMKVTGWSAQMYSAFVGAEAPGHDGMRCAPVLFS